VRAAGFELTLAGAAERIRWYPVAAFICIRAAGAFTVFAKD
jgi:hypothetical protein